MVYLWYKFATSEFLFCFIHNFSSRFLFGRGFLANVLTTIVEDL